MKSEKTKLIIALVIFAVAAVVIVLQTGLLSGGSASPPIPKSPDNDATVRRGGAHLATPPK